MFPKGLGVADLPYQVYQGKQPIKSADFKDIVNQIFLPKIHELGFKGKDFYFYRENKTYTEVVFFWVHKTGGAIQVDLLVRFHTINYPGEKPANKIRPETAEFQRRLSPHLDKNTWFWIFAKDLNDNVRIVEDIWRLFSIRGIKYLKQFENHSQYIKKITPNNYSDYPDFFIQHFFGRHEEGVIYFLFAYWQQQQNKERATVFARLGMNKPYNEPYVDDYRRYLESIQP